MKREIPGTICVRGIEVLYVEIATGQGFRQLIDEAMELPGSAPMPQSGGVIEEKAWLDLSDGSTLLAISYKGDVPGWRGKLAAYCESKGRRWGVASNAKLILSDGTEVDLSESNVTVEG